MSGFVRVSRGANCQRLNGLSQTGLTSRRFWHFTNAAATKASAPVISFLATLLLFGGVGVVAVRGVTQYTAEKHRSSFELYFPFGLKPEAIADYLRIMAHMLPRPKWRYLAHTAFVLETRASHAGIRHVLQLPEASADTLLAQLRAIIPGVRAVQLDSAAASMRPLVARELRLRSRLFPLNTEHAQAAMLALLASLQPLAPGETITTQLVMAPVTSPRVPRRRASKPYPLQLPWWAQMLVNAVTPNPLTPDQLAAAEIKLAEPAFSGSLRIGATAQTIRRGRTLVHRQIAPLQIMRTQQTHFMRRLVPNPIATGRLQRASLPLMQFPVTVNALELAALSAWPIMSPVIPGLRVGASRLVPPPAAIPLSGHILGEANYPGVSRPVAVGIRESLRHTHIIGPTGSGKSTLLVNLAVQDMEAGRGLAVFDPKGDLIEDILARVPRNRINDVVVIDPTDPKMAVGLNLLERSQTISNEVAVDQIVGTFKRLFAGFWGPRTDDVLRSCLLTLAYHPNTTLVDVPLLLQDPDYRSRIVGVVDDPVGLEPFWEWYEGLSDKERSQVVGPVLNKLRALLLRKTVRDIVGQPQSTIRMSEIMAQNKILLVSLPKGLLGEDTSSLLGSLLVMNLYQAAQQRGALPVEHRKPFFCYIDEFQDYLNLPQGVETILAQARGFGFGLIMAHQQLAQLSKEVRDGVLTNARTKVVFQTSAGDARALADEFEPQVSASDLQNLEPHQAFVMVALDGQPSAVASIATAPPPKAVSNPKQLKDMSAAKYGRSRYDIEQVMRARLVAKFTSNEVTEPEE
jgi:energy-coupling factor transporter ATP-binding protein EcfA2